MNNHIMPYVNLRRVWPQRTRMEKDDPIGLKKTTNLHWQKAQKINKCTWSAFSNLPCTKWSSWGACQKHRLLCPTPRNSHPEILKSHSMILMCSIIWEALPHRMLWPAHCGRGLQDRNVLAECWQQIHTQILMGQVRTLVTTKEK